VASRQHKLYGEILLIHPFSLAFFSWLGLGLAAVSLAYLLLGHITEHARISGVISAQFNMAHEAQAELSVPERAMGYVHAGDRFAIRCAGCGPLTATVQQISPAPSHPSESSPQDSQETMYAVRVALTGPPQPQTALHPGARVEASVPLARKPLLQWLFERPGD
jgi:heme exporter protein D